ncbi:MAG: DMT family transporter [Candidatus Nanoarchaeia archaeon]|nr:DMT family transporter [Candidatus Nanoarchaeia archaeon]
MLWVLYITLAIFFLSSNILLVKTLVRKISPFAVLFYQYLIAIPLVFIYSLMTGSKADLNVLWSIPLGFIYVVAIALFYIGLKKGNLSKVSPVFNMNLLVTSLLSIVFFAEQFNLKIILGLVFGVVSVYLIGGAKK